MKRCLLFTLVFLGCNNAELEREKLTNSTLRHELDSIKSYIVKEETKKRFYGEYVTEENEFVRSLNFKGETSVIISGLVKGWGASYVKDGNIVRIQFADYNLILSVKDAKTLIGEGGLAGITYQKKD